MDYKVSQVDQYLQRLGYALDDMPEGRDASYAVRQLRQALVSALNDMDDRLAAIENHLRD